MTITVQVKLFATLRQRYPHLGIGEPMPVDLPEDATAAQLLAHLEIPDDQVKIVWTTCWWMVMTWASFPRWEVGR
jgi:hypothetical protein